MPPRACRTEHTPALSKRRKGAGHRAPYSRSSGPLLTNSLDSRYGVIVDYTTEEGSKIMKSIYAALIVVLVSLSPATLAQTAAPASEAQSSFNRLKSLSGTWDGKVTTTPPAPEIDGTTMHVTLRT